MLYVSCVDSVAVLVEHDVKMAATPSDEIAARHERLVCGMVGGKYCSGIFLNYDPRKPSEISWPGDDSLDLSNAKKTTN